MSGCSNPRSVASVQITATRINGGGVEKCSHTDPDRTHYSIYLRAKDGTVEWVADFAPQHLTTAMIEAVRLSMAHFVPIEPMEGMDLAVVRGK